MDKLVVGSFIISALSFVMVIVTFILTQSRISKTNTKESTEDIVKIKKDMEHYSARFAREEKTIDENKLAIERLNEVNRNVLRRLDSIDALKIDANLAGIQAELKHIRALLECNNKNRESI